MTPVVNAVAASGTASPAGAKVGLEQAGKGLSATPFAYLIGDAAGQVERLQAQANAAVTGLMAGNGVDVHQAVIATEKASMAFELALAVRNKAVQAYQSVMSMQF